MHILQKSFKSQADLQGNLNQLVPKFKKELIEDSLNHKKQLEKVLSSRSWRYTKIFRTTIGATRKMLLIDIHPKSLTLSKKIVTAIESIKMWKEYFFYAHFDRRGRDIRFLTLNLPDLADYPLLAKSLHKQLFIRKDNFKSEADWSLIAASDVTLSKYTLIEFFKAVIEHPHASHFYCNTVDSRQGWSFTKPSWDSLYNSSIPLLPPLYFSNANLSEFFPIRLKDALVTEYQRSTPLRDSSDFGLPMFPLIKLGKSGEDVSVIIPTANKRVKTSEGESWLLESIVASIADSKDLGRVEVVVVDNGNLTRDEKRELSKYLKIKYVTDQHRKLNLSRKINMGVSLAKNERLILCNDDIKPENRSTLSLLIPWLDQDNVGVVGPRIHYVGGQLQYAGVSVVDGKCHILGYKQPFDSMGHGWSFLIPRFVSAVTGVLMATTRSCFDSVNGWDKSFPINFNDIDYCLRAKLANYQTVLEPRSRIFHLESASRDLSLPYENDELRFGARWEKHKDVWPELPFITGMPGPESSHDWRKRNLEWKI